MSIHQDLLEDQKAAAIHIGSNARLLAGPGTGKTFTLTHRICYLIQEKNIQPENIHAITFTRAAAQELRQRVESMLDRDRCPSISTLHSFALKQLRHNPIIIQDLLPTPPQIADSWEEDEIIIKDIKALLNLGHVKDARELFQRLSADWQSLDADEEGWEDTFNQPKFLGAWREHRKIYGYTLTSELVYQLKKALEQYGNFTLDSCIEHLLIDEYQDLNHCDLAVVKSIESHGSELFVVGDDDQSIYGFRKAHPDGIRDFCTNYPDATELELTTCMRCDQDILELGLFVARQDPRSIRKKIQTKPNSNKGEVKILRFKTNTNEARGISNLCNYLMKKHRLEHSESLILLRSDHRGVFSGLIKEKIEDNGIIVTVSKNSNDLLDIRDGRSFLSFLKLSVSREDSLAWRSLFMNWCNGIGSRAINEIYECARNHDRTFGQTVIDSRHDLSIFKQRFQNRLSIAIDRVIHQLDEIFSNNDYGEYDTREQLMSAVHSMAEAIISEEQQRCQILKWIDQVSKVFESNSINQLIRALDIGVKEFEQKIEDESVNILTMHQAKGLTAKAVIVAVAEDQMIPGQNQGSNLDDERRLLYVSLTRAKHFLFITYCDKRTAQQSHTGRNSGDPNRSLTQFLQDYSLVPQNGEEFVAHLQNLNP